MTENELRNLELNRHAENIDQNIERNQSVNLDEKERNIASVNQNAGVARIVNIIYFLFGTLELLLATRFILHLVGVNSENNFARFIYDVSAPFVGLFTSLLENPTLTGTSVFEVTTIIAMLVWAIVGGLTGRLVWLVLSRTH